MRAGLTWHVYEGSLWPSAAGTQRTLRAPHRGTKRRAACGSTIPAEPPSSERTAPTYAGSLRRREAQPGRMVRGRGGAAGLRTECAQRLGRVRVHRRERQCDPLRLSQQYEFDRCRQLHGAGDWDNALQAYATANGITSWWTGNTQPWTQDQFKADLASGNVANYNFIVPDQDDDMHNTGRSRVPTIGSRTSSRRSNPPRFGTIRPSGSPSSSLSTKANRRPPRAAAGTRSARATERRSW
jgi:hypothetical protein